MAKFIEILKDGLTVRGRVQRAGVRVQVSETFEIESKKAQVDRWGAPRYRQITQADFEGVGGEVVASDPEPPAVEEDKTEEAAVEPFAEFDGLNAEETLLKVAELPEDQLAAFITFEAEGANRKSVLEPLGVEFE